MKLSVLAAVLMLFAMSSRADNVKWETYAFPGGEGALSISEEPCTHPAILAWFEEARVLTKAKMGHDIGDVKQARLLWHGEIYASCYILGPKSGNVYSVDSALDPLTPSIPRDQFVPHDKAMPKNKGTEI